MDTDIFGAFIFGLVVGYITYRTLLHAKRTAIGEISGVIAAIGGGVVTAEFIHLHGVQVAKPRERSRQRSAKVNSSSETTYGHGYQLPLPVA